MSPANADYGGSATVPGRPEIGEPAVGEPAIEAPPVAGSASTAGNLPERPFTVLIAALGGEGGGVLADWLLAAARDCDFPVQSTSIPGVAQRTGATTYYLEIFPVAAAELGDRRPVFALTPSPGNVDLMAASELIEAGRAMQNGYVTPGRTTLVASTHRVYSTGEKIVPGDGRFAAGRVEVAAAQLARRRVLFDMAGFAEASTTLINAVLFGAMAGSGALPLPRASCEQAIRAGGKGAEASLRGFASGHDRAVALLAGSPAGVSADSAGAAVGAAGADSASAAVAAASAAAAIDAAVAPGAGASLPEALAAMLADLPAAARETAAHGVRRLLDYQDRAYAQRYLGRLLAIAGAERAAGGDAAVARETARQLALWMSYEDVIRVADLKGRLSRLQRVRAEVRAQPGEPVELVEYLRPGTEELASVLPPGLAGALRRWGLRGGRDRLAQALHLRTSSVAGFAALRLLASLRRWRPRSSRFRDEQAAIDRWLGCIAAAAGRSPQLAREIAEVARLRKGYGDTYARGRATFDRILSTLVEGSPGLTDDERAAAIREARAAALADPPGRDELRAPGGGMGAAARPVTWMKPSVR